MKQLEVCIHIYNSFAVDSHILIRVFLQKLCVHGTKRFRFGLNGLPIYLPEI